MNAFLATWVDAWAGWMSAMAWQAGLVILIVALLDRFVLSRAWPGLRYALWSVTALKLLLPPTLASPMSVTAPAASRVGPLVELPAAQPAESGFAWVSAAAAVWLAGVAVLAVLSLRRGFAFRRRLRRTALPAPDFLQTHLRDACRALSLEAAPRLALSRAVTTPAVTGLRRPVILLPLSFGIRGRHGHEEIRHVLLHEAAHVRRGDLWAAAAFAALHLLYWFHPLVALARRRAHAAREVCCDLTVARALGGGDAYRETLLAHASRLLAPAAPGPAAAGFLWRRSTVLMRLAALERHGGRPAGRARVLTAVAVAAIAAVVLPMAVREAPSPAGDTALLRVELDSARAHLADTLGEDGRYGCFAKRFAYYDVLRAQAALDRLGRSDPRGTP